MAPGLHFDNATPVETRSFAVAGLYFVGFVNGVAEDIVDSFITHGALTAAANTFNVSVVVIVAAVAGLNWAMQVRSRAIDWRDRVSWAIYLLALCVPRGFVSLVALSLLACYEGFRNPRSAEATAAASLFLGITVCLLWGRLTLQLFALPILAVDATLVAGLLNLIEGGGVARVANVVDNAHGQSLIILPACSSVANISYALLCWMALVRFTRPSWAKGDLFIVLVIIFGVVVLNLLRMALMGVDRDLYLLVHSSAGTDVINSLFLLLAVGAAWHTSRRAAALS